MFSNTRATAMCVALAALVMALVACGAPQPTATLLPATTTPVPPTETPPATSTPTPTVAAKTDEELVADIDSYLSELAKNEEFSGSVLVARSGRILLSRGYGLADQPEGIENTPQTRFRIGEVTMPFTAMAVLILQEQGKLDAKDPICDYIEDCPEAWEAITIHHLLTHTSGLTSVYTRGSPDDAMERLALGRLKFNPGEAWELVRSNYYVLGYLIERVSGQPYEEFVRETVFERLEMKDTGICEDCSGLAAGYEINATVLFHDIPVLHAASGLYSTVEDLYRWDRALYTEELVSQELLDEMFAPSVPIPDNPFGLAYGYGWFVGRPEGRMANQHGGVVPGFSSAMSRCPDDNVTIIVLSNLDYVDTLGIVDSLADMVFAEE